MKKFLYTAILSLFAFASFAQTVISGKLLDKETNEALIGVNIVIKGTVTGTISDQNGAFKISTNASLPLKLEFSVIGYKSQVIDVTENNQQIDLSMEVQNSLVDEVVISASRVEESLLRSPVSIEKLDLLALRNSASASFYDALINLKGVDMSTQSLTFKAPNTRGFVANGNTRFSQIIDGMDNQAPGLNFPVGNMVGISELDLESIELLPGASSALYGPGAINGTLLMNSKSPFRYQGLSAYVKSGAMHLGASYGNAQPFYDVGFRYAKAFNDKFAFKLNFNYLAAQDWQATNFDDRITASTTRENNPNYNGVNIYGDEASANLRSVAQSLVGAGLLPAQALPLFPNVNISRTGYAEKELVDYNVKNLKLNAALHYRISDDVEALIQGSYGQGTTVYTGANRYSLKNLSMTQVKAEVRGSNFFVRGYTTIEDSGDSYDAVFASLAINNEWKNNNTWFGQYTGAFAQAKQRGLTDEQAHAAARGAADTGRLMPGTPEFEAAKSKVTSKNINANLDGAKFNDATKLYHVEGMFNFNKIIDPKTLEIIVGSSYRMFDLNSNGTIFPDRDGRKITISEFGAYAQFAKRLLEERLKITASARFDKNENFDGRVTPRVAVVYSAGENRQHNFRVSYQTGFRNPTTQGQYIDLNLGATGHLLGGLQELKDTYFKGQPVYTPENVAAFGAAVQTTAALPATQQAAAIAVIQSGIAQTDPRFAGAVAAKVFELAVAGSASTLQPFTFRKFAPETVQSYEVGYKGMFNDKLMIDGYVYWNAYTNFEAQQVVLQPTANGVAGLLSANTRKGYQVYTSSDKTINTWGWALGLDYSLPRGYTLSGNVAYNTIDTEGSQNQQIGFNTPEYRTVLTFANRNIAKNVGFSVSYRWQDAFMWESTFGTGNVDAYSTLDAQVSYKISKIKSILKVGGSNILNQYYRQAYGNPAVGATWYVSLSFDQFLN